jgi:hypothetical protein
MNTIEFVLPTAAAIRTIRILRVLRPIHDAPTRTPTEIPMLTTTPVLPQVARSKIYIVSVIVVTLAITTGVFPWREAVGQTVVYSVAEISGRGFLAGSIISAMSLAEQAILRRERLEPPSGTAWPCGQPI